MRFLLTNDDGISAPGLAALCRAAGKLGEVFVVAPLSPLSGCSHRATTGEPMALTEIDENRWSLDGTPADCVRVARTWLKLPFDWVLSGVNAGGNLGHDVFLSGTVAAVREAAVLGIPGVALSAFRREVEFDWPKAESWARETLSRLLSRRPSAGEYFNVNFPDAADVDPDAGNASPAIVECPLDLSPLPVAYREESGHLRYCGRYQSRRRTSGADVDVCFSGRIAVTRLSLR